MNVVEYQLLNLMIVFFILLNIGFMDLEVWLPISNELACPF
jgi:hypothetical protein